MQAAGHVGRRQQDPPLDDRAGVTLEDRHRALVLAPRVWRAVFQEGDVAKELVGPGPVLPGERLLAGFQGSSRVSRGLTQVAPSDPVSGPLVLEAELVSPAVPVVSGEDPRRLLQVFVRA